MYLYIKKSLLPYFWYTFQKAVKAAYVNISFIQTKTVTSYLKVFSWYSLCKFVGAKQNHTSLLSLGIYMK